MGTPAAIGGGSVWAMALDTEVSAMVDPRVSLARIDPGSNRVTARIPVAGPGIGGVVAMAYGAGSVWLVDSDQESHNVVSKVDPGRNRVVDRVTVGLQPVVPVPGCCSGPVTAAAGAIWAAESRSGTLVRFEPATHRIVRIRLDDVVDLVSAGDQVVAVGHTHVTWIAPSTNRVSGVLPVGQPSGIAGGDGMVWVADLESKSLKRVAAP